MYEFHGRFWYGCSKGYPDRDKPRHKMCDQTVADAYEATKRKEDALLAKSNSVIVIWQHEWEQFKKEDDTVCTVVDSFDLVSRLQPRDALLSGRTNVYCNDLYYYEFTSLYPWTNKNCLYPVGHPIILYKPEGTDISSYFGLMKRKILPPYHPVLLYRNRSGGKLTFPLFRACVEHEPLKPLTERS